MATTTIKGAAAAMDGFSLSPSWIDALLTEKFFGACSKHPTTKKNERNVFCVECSGSICQHCLGAHARHRLVQVRRYVYQDVIRLHDMEKLLKCELVQTYTINSAKVVFLNPRPQSRPSKGLSNSCETCERSLQESYCYCSIACKVEALVRQKKDLPSCLISQKPASEEVFTISPAESLQRGANLEEGMDEGDSQTTTSSATSIGKADDQQQQQRQQQEAAAAEAEAAAAAAEAEAEAAADCSAGRGAISAPAFSMLIPPPKRIRSSRCGAAAVHHCPSLKSVIAHCFSSRRKGVPHRSPFS